MSSKCRYIGLAVSAAMLVCSVARADIRDTIQNAKSGTTVQCSGSYTVSKIVVPSGVTVKGPATFNFNSTSSDGFYIKSSTTGVVLQSLTIKNAYHGIRIDGSNNKVTSCTISGNHNTGIHISGSYGQGKNNTISGCTATGNADNVGNADGFGIKDGAGSGNSYANCTAYNNSDDGWDFYGANGTVSVSGCQAYSNGYNSNGNGDGFKMGGTYNYAHTYTSCTAHNETGTTGRGFDTNHNTAQIKITSCHSYSNKSKDVLGNSIVSNSTMQQ